jgi:hypothetical protein
MTTTIPTRAKNVTISTFIISGMLFEAPQIVAEEVRSSGTPIA